MAADRSPTHMTEFRKISILRKKNTIYNEHPVPADQARISGQFVTLCVFMTNAKKICFLSE